VSGKRKVVCCLWFVVENNAIQSANIYGISARSAEKKRNQELKLCLWFVVWGFESGEARIKNQGKV